MADAKRDLQNLSDEVWARTRTRLEGLTDEEYFWEPAPGCWSLRQRADGSWCADGTLPRPDLEPFTTIAWRLWHLIDMYGEDRAPRWLGVPPQGAPIGLDAHDEPPSNAPAALDLLVRAHDRWDAHLALVDSVRLAEPVGSIAGPNYADRPRSAYVLHMLDEVIHHGAEIALLRDLWRWQHPLEGVEPLRESVIRGERAHLDEIAAAPDATDVLDVAAAYGRWDLLVELCRRGVAPRADGRTPLHLAAGAGELDVVRFLVEQGVDPTVRDPEYHATPQQWAEFLAQPVVVEFLTGRATLENSSRGSDAHGRVERGESPPSKDEDF